MCLAQGPQCSDKGEARTHNPSVSSQALYHQATTLPKVIISWQHYSTTRNAPYVRLRLDSILEMCRTFPIGVIFALFKIRRMLYVGQSDT